MKNIHYPILAAALFFAACNDDDPITPYEPVLKSGEIQLEGKTTESHYANSVYVDLSLGEQTAVDRKSWTLGFYCGEEFTVFLNGAYETVAAASTKTDIDDITMADAEAVINLNASPMSFTDDYLRPAAADSPGGAVSGTVWGSVPVDVADSHVFFVATADDKASRGDWYKVSVCRNGNGYAVRYGKVDGSMPVKSVEIERENANYLNVGGGAPVGRSNIAKDADHNMRFLSLESGLLVDVEPQAAKWDFVWGYNTGFTAVDLNGSDIEYRPYFMQDLVLINNLAGVKAAQIMAADIAYDDYSAADIASTTFSGERNVIGSNWRATSPPASAGVFGDRFYVIKDVAGNYYKMQAVSAGLGSPAVGERGRPVFRYKLVE